VAFDTIDLSDDSAVRAQLDALNAELRGASAQAILEAGLKREWPGQVVYVSSFGAESVAMLALIADVDRHVPVIFIDTGMHFPQTLDHRDAVAERLGLTNIRTLTGDADAIKAADPKKLLWKSDTDACCEVRKVRPLEPALAGYRAWITGRKRFHGGGRVQLPVAEFADGRFKLNPLVSWTPEDVEAFIAARDLPRHPLVAEGYPSIGCWPCTKPVEKGADPRAGRWAGLSKTECGLHVDKKERPRVF
jgi:phosphoadenosine phosphosulfate reductase